VDRPLLTDAMHVLRLFVAWLAFVLAWGMLEPTLGRLWYQLGGEQVTQQALLPIDQAPDSWSDRLSADCPIVEATETTIPSPASRPFLLATPSAQSVRQREVLLDLSQVTATVSLRAEFDRCSPLLQQLRATMSGQEVLDEPTLDRIRNIVFNSVVVDSTGADFEALQISTAETAPDTVQVSTRGRFMAHQPMDGDLSYLVTIGSLGPWQATSTKVRVKVAPSMGIWTEAPLPNAQSSTEALWHHLPANQANLVLNVTRSNDRAKANQDQAAPIARLAPPLVQALRGHLDVLNPLWLGVGYGLPFVVLLWWARRLATPESDIVQALTKGCSLALLLLAGLVLAEAVERAGMRPWRKHLEGSGLFNSGWAPSTARAVFIALIWPTLAVLWLQGKLVRPAAALGWTAGVLVVGLLSAMVVLARFKGLARFDQLDLTVQLEPLSISLSPDSVMTLLAVLLAIGLSAWWLAIESVGFLRSFGSLIKWVLGMALIWLLTRWLTYTGEPTVAALLALPFGWAFARASVHWWPSDTTWLTPGRRMLCSLLGALAMAWLAVPPAGPGYTSASWLLGTLAWSLAHLWRVAAMALLVYWLILHASQARQARLPIEQQTAAWVFLIVVFYWRASSDWVPMMVALMIGWGLARYWVFAPRPLRLPTRSRPRMLHHALKVMSRHRELTGWQRDMQKGLSEQWIKGEATLTKAQNRSGEVHRAIATSEYADMRARALTQLALNVGTSAHAHTAAWRGALMATLLSLPWITSYCVNVSRSDPPLTNAYAVSQLTFIVLDLLRWPALGYFLMYYYPHLRGRNGIEKGLCLAAALILPSLGATVLWNASANDAWLSLLYWSLQVFICCMTIGVGLGDLGALRRAGKGPRSLKEIYKLGTLAAWFSSLALAVGGAATTVLVSQLGSLFTAGLKLMAPDIPPVGK